MAVNLCAKEELEKVVATDPALIGIGHLEERDVTKAENARLKERVKKPGPQTIFFFAFLG